MVRLLFSGRFRLWPKTIFFPLLTQATAIRIALWSPDRIRTQWYLLSVAETLANMVQINFFVFQNFKSYPLSQSKLNFQPVYLDVDAAQGPFTVRITTSGNGLRRWNIQIIQIECGNPSRAPANCLQYHVSVSFFLIFLNFSFN